MKKFSKVFLQLVALFFFCTSCGEKSNFNQIFVSAEQKESLQVLMDKALILYDKGEYKSALSFAEKAHKISPNNEDINVLLGYIHLSLAGMGTFEIAKGLIASTDDTSTSTDTSTGTGAGTSLTVATGSSGATQLFGTLSKIINMSEDDFSTLGSIEEDTDLEYFADYPVLTPITALEARASNVGLFKNVQSAIKYICPFVDEEVKLPDADDRHGTEQCVPSTLDRQSKVKSHFLWAFAHLAEATAFYSVVLYTSEGAEQANIQARADNLEANKTGASIGNYVAHIVNLADRVNAVLDTSEDSQFNGILHGLTIASSAFSAIGNLPDSVKGSLTKAVSSITASKDKVSGGSAGEKEGNAFKNQINSGTAKQLENKIDSISDAEFAANKTDLCGSYTSISGSKTQPTRCTE